MCCKKRYFISHCYIMNIILAYNYLLDVLRLNHPDASYISYEQCAFDLLYNRVFDISSGIFPGIY